MVFNPEAVNEKARITAFLTANLTPDQLDAIQDAFGKGSFFQSPDCPMELFIKDTPEYHGLSHADIRRKETDGNPFLIIDEKTPVDGGIWYIDDFASEDEVEDELAESTNVLWKIRIKTEHIPITHVNYDIGNMSIREDLDNVGGDYPLPEEFEQEELHTSGLDLVEDRFVAPTYVTVEPGEYEETTDPEVLKTLLPSPKKMYRLKPEIAKAHGLIPRWTVGSTAKPRTLLDGSTRTFPEGSLVLSMEYDKDHPWGSYKRPEGSL